MSFKTLKFSYCRNAVPQKEMHRSHKEVPGILFVCWIENESWGFHLTSFHLTSL